LKRYYLLFLSFLKRVPSNTLRNSDILQILAYPFLSLTGGILETLTVSSIPLVLPLLLPNSPLDSNPNDLINRLIVHLGSGTAIFIILPLLIIASTITRIIVSRQSIRISSRIGHVFSSALYNSLLFSDFRLFRVIDQSQAVACFSIHINYIVYHVIRPFLDCISAFLLVLTVGSTLISLYPRTFIIVSLFLGLAYFISIIFSSNRGKRLSKHLLSRQSQLLALVDDTIRGMLEIKVSKVQRLFHEEFIRSDQSIRNVQNPAALLPLLPRIVIEGLSVLVILFIIFFVIFILNEPPEQLLAEVAVLVFASQKIIPQLQIINSSIVSIQTYKPSLSLVLSFIMDLISTPPTKSLDPGGSNSASANAHSLYGKLIGLRSSTVSNIFLTATSLQYSISIDGQTSLISIPRLSLSSNSSVAIVGRSGCGKTTLLSSLLGLLPLDYNEFFLRLRYSDSMDQFQYLGDEARLCLSEISALAPQFPHIYNKSLRYNISFQDESSVSHQALLDKILAQLSFDDVFGRDPRLLDRKLGGDGLTLSGGQRQLVGIARALFLKKPVLFLDEPTSALDSTSACVIHNLIKSKPGNIAVVVVTHDDKLARACDDVIALSDISRTT
jgi:ABC-type multidrug transport system fused ATPase/permease subunit